VTLHELAVHNAALNYADGGLRTRAEKFDLSLRDLVADTARKTVAVGELASSSARLQILQATAAEPASPTHRMWSAWPRLPSKTGRCNGKTAAAPSHRSWICQP
jgi:hypothetical protein